jgi:hypothetical protein
MGLFDGLGGLGGLTPPTFPSPNSNPLGSFGSVLSNIGSIGSIAGSLGSIGGLLGGAGGLGSMIGLGGLGGVLGFAAAPFTLGLSAALPFIMGGIKKLFGLFHRDKGKQAAEKWHRHYEKRLKQLQEANSARNPPLTATEMEAQAAQGAYNDLSPSEKQNFANNPNHSSKCASYYNDMLSKIQTGQTLNAGYANTFFNSLQPNAAMPNLVANLSGIQNLVYRTIYGETESLPAYKGMKPEQLAQIAQTRLNDPTTIQSYINSYRLPITMDQVKAQPGITLADQLAHAIMAKFDTNGDGVISQSEAYAAYGVNPSNYVNPFGTTSSLFGGTFGSATSSNPFLMSPSTTPLGLSTTNLFNAQNFFGMPAVSTPTLNTNLFGMPNLMGPPVPATAVNPPPLFFGPPVSAAAINPNPWYNMYSTSSGGFQSWKDQQNAWELYKMQSVLKDLDWLQQHVSQTPPVKDIENKLQAELDTDTLAYNTRNAAGAVPPASNTYG